LANTATADPPIQPPDRVAVIDLGSNTVLLLVLQRDGTVVYEDARITRLGQGVFDSGRLASEAMERTEQAAAELAERAGDTGAACLVVVGTEALRRAEDGAAFLSRLGARIAADAVRLLSGDEEARFAIEDSRRARPGGAGPRLIDVGGGSTELAWLAGGRVRGISLPIGSVRLSEAWVRSHPTPVAEREQLRQAARDALAGVAGPPSDLGVVVAVAGTATTLAALELALDPYDADRVEGYRMTREQLGEWTLRLADLDLAGRRALPGLEPGRADVIVAGLLILDEVLAHMDARDFLVSGRGVRHGVALALLDGSMAV
jgi:exopolyphosphatase/guanosine-5'-triphosphate,3'-diphosphate pyrophosphatase